MFKVLLFFTFFSNFNAYTWLLPAWKTTHYPSRKLIKKISDVYYNKYEPYNITSSKQCIFFPGGNTCVPSEIYTNFLTKLSEQNLIVNIANPKLLDNHVYLKTITNNEPTTLVAHSSGTTSALNMCKYMDNVEKIILLDPVDSRILSSNENVGDIYNFDHQNVDSVFLINAEKSYKWHYFPFPRIPFIPFWGLSKDSFDINNKKLIKLPEYGHCDILDYTWGEVMHNSLSEGLENRNEISIDNYHEWLARVISNYINNSTVINDNTIKFNHG